MRYDGWGSVARECAFRSFFFSNSTVQSRRELLVAFIIDTFCFVSRSCGATCRQSFTSFRYSLHVVKLNTCPVKHENVLKQEC